MNAGFSNLDTLKKHLLADTLASETKFDVTIAAIGLGMAGAIEQFCQRKFGYAAGVTESFSADRIHFILSRTPLIELTQAELKQDESGGWEAQTIADFIRTIDSDRGIIYLPDQTDPGDYWSLVRFTYTGGYFWEQLEPADDGYPTDVPDGATALPDEVRLAWMMQCEQVWARRDKLGISLLDKPAAQSDLEEIELIPLVKKIIGNFVRIQMV